MWLTQTGIAAKSSYSDLIWFLFQRFRHDVAHKAALPQNLFPSNQKVI